MFDKGMRYRKHSVLEVELEAGQLLYIPRGYMHEAAVPGNAEGPSVYVSAEAAPRAEHYMHRRAMPLRWPQSCMQLFTW